MKRILYLILCLLLVFSVTGCKNSDGKTELKEQEYYIYYLNGAATKLTPHIYEAAGTTPEALTEELMEQFLAVPNEVEGQCALLDKVGYRGYQREERVLYLYFDANYTIMKPAREILCRAALVKTLTQIEGIEYINIYCGDQPLTDSSGATVGMMTSSDFIESISDVNTFEKTELTLYFANETGDKLVPETREVVHNINTSLERLIVEELIEGPTKEGCYATLPSNTKLLNVTVNENICYLNFDGAFLDNKMEGEKDIPIYSIVNSLSEMANVNQVQITVNGSNKVMFRDVISLENLFERNMEKMEGTSN